MTKKQLIVILCIIFTPVLIGTILLSPMPKGKGRGAIALSTQTKKIGLLRITDIISSSESYVKQLEFFRTDNSIAGIIVRIDSPGGGVSPSQEIYAALMHFRQSLKPIVVSMGDVAASGGYYIACTATKIFANPGTITGSIGVIMQFPHYYKLLEKVGVDITTIKAGSLKDIGNPTRAVSGKEQIFLQDIIDVQHEQFIKDVSIARNMSVETVRSFADGRIFTGTQAKEAGLIDSIGGFQAAVSYLLKTLDLPEKTKVIERNKNSELIRDILTENVFMLFPFLKKAAMKPGSYFLLEHF